MRDLLALVLENVRRRWQERRDRRVLGGEALFVELDQVWSRASSRRWRREGSRQLGGPALRSAPGGSAAPTSSLADDLRSRLIARALWLRRN